MKTVVVTLDDTGRPDIINVDGVTISIDKNEPRAHALRQSLDAYIRTAKRADRTGPLYRLVPVGADDARTRDIRTWWREHPDGLPQWKERGRLPKAVIEAFHGRRDRPPPRIVTWDVLAVREAEASVRLDGDTQCVECPATP